MHFHPPLTYCCCRQETKLVLEHGNINVELIMVVVVVVGILRTSCRWECMLLGLVQKGDAMSVYCETIWARHLVVVLLPIVP